MKHDGHDESVLYDDVRLVVFRRAVVVIACDL